MWWYVDLVLAWICRISVSVEACAAVPDFQVTLTGGDGNAVQYCE